jgi:hypothetical protein
MSLTFAPGNPQARLGLEEFNLNASASPSLSLAHSLRSAHSCTRRRGMTSCRLRWGRGVWKNYNTQYLVSSMMGHHVMLLDALEHIYAA